MNDNIVIIIIVIIILISLLLIFLFRHEYFKPSEDIDQYGTYSEKNVTSCYNMTGRCSDTGISITSQDCIPNSTNGRGCVGPNGEQTFASKTETKACSIACRSQVWQIIETSPCLYNDENVACVLPGTEGTQTITQICVPNDSTGPNMCLLENDPFTNNIPDGCFLSTNFPNMIECNIETTVTTTVNCVPSQFTKPICGIWGVRDILNYETNNVQYSNATNQCYNGILPVPSYDCYAPDGRKYTLDSDILKPGFNTQAMQCFQKLSPDASGYSSTLLPGNAICTEYPGCIIGGEVQSIDNGNNSTVRCQDFNNPEVPGCVNSCVYIPPNLAPTQYRLPQFQYLFASYFYLQKDNFFVSLEYTPCPLDNNNSYLPATSAAIKDGSGTLFTDCFAFTGSQLENFVPAVAIDALDAQNNTNSYQLLPSCLASTITNNSNLLLFFKPRPVLATDNPNEYRCCILAVLGKSWIGYLTTNGGSQMGWTPSTISIFDTVGTTDETADTFVITYTNSKYNILYESSIGVTTNLSIPIMYPRGYNGSLPLTGLDFISPSYGGIPINTIKNINERFSALNNLLNIKQTRLNSNTCNIYYHNGLLLPAGYPNPDVSNPEF
jgi:hypothetical protein